MINLPRKMIPNPDFAGTLGPRLPSGWTIEADGENWKVSPPSESTGVEYFSGIQRVHSFGADPLGAVVEKMANVESHAEHLKWIKEAHGPSKLELHVKYGFSARLHVNKVRFFTLPFNEINQQDKEFFSSLAEEFRLRSAFVFKKEIEPHVAMMAIRRFAYQLPLVADGSRFELEKNSFWGSLPHGLDFSTYIDPFLVFSPVFFGFPIDRMLSGIVFLPDKSSRFPFEASIGIPNLLLSAPGDIFEHGMFKLFDEGPLTKIFVRRYVEFIIRTNNRFVSWLMHPKSCLDSEGIYDPRYGLQIPASVHGIFQAFHQCAGVIAPLERAQHAFVAFDRLSNLAIHFSQLRKPIDQQARPGEVPSLEARAFKKFFSAQFARKIANATNRKIPDPKVAGSFQTAFTRAIESLHEALSGYGKDPTEMIRLIRNLSHGAFLKNDEFLKTFSKKATKLPGDIPALLYSYMVSFYVDPEFLLTQLANDE